MADKHIISLISMIVGSIAVAVILRLIGPDSTIFQISLFTGLAGFLVGFLGGWCFHHWSYSSQHIALERQRIALDRLKEENQEKQRQWERDRAEPTAAQKAEAAAQYEQRRDEAMARHHLTLSFGHPVDQDKNRACERCLLKYDEVHIFETRKGYRFPACPKCGNE